MKKKSAIYIINIVFLLLLGCSTAKVTNGTDMKYIGEAKILDDGTIIVHSFVQEIDGKEAHAQIVTEYKPDDPNYAVVKKHIGEIRSGETKLVRPFSIK